MTSRLLALVLVLAGCGATTYTQGVPNFGQVTSNVFHSGQPATDSEWYALRGLLCAGRAPCRVHVAKLNRPSEGSDDGGRALGFDVTEFGMHPYTDAFPYFTEIFASPDPATTARLEAWIAAIPEVDNGVDVYLFHCVHGWDRTMRAVWEYLYRLRGWTWDAAKSYAVAHGYHTVYYKLSRPWTKPTETKSPPR